MNTKKGTKLCLGMALLGMITVSTAVPVFAESFRPEEGNTTIVSESETDTSAVATASTISESTTKEDSVSESATSNLSDTENEETETQSPDSYTENVTDETTEEPVEELQPEIPENGFLKEEDHWTYYENGQEATFYTGFIQDGQDVYYVQHGIVDFQYTGLAWSENWYYFRNSKMDLSYNGMTTNEYGTWYVKNGMVLFDFTGLAWCGKWYYFRNNGFNPTYCGLSTNEYGTWYVKNGMVLFDYTGLAYCGDTWYYFDKNYLDRNYTWLSTNSYGTWYVVKGVVDFSYTGLAWCGEWYYFNRNGLDRSYTGLCSNENGTWYVKNGKVDFTYNGTIYWNRGTYTIQKSKAVSVKFTVPGTSQTPKYPTGCEGAAATTLLKYYGINVSLDEMIGAIPRENLRTENGRRVGPSIYEKFVGDPTGTYTSKNPGYGAFAPVVRKAINTVLIRKGSNLRAYDLSGSSISTIYSYLLRGYPVIVWSTYNMQNPKSVNSWYIKQSDGSYQYFSYPRGTHVTVLTGYDANNVYMMDVYGAVNKTFSRSTFEARYKLLYQQAVVVK